MHGSRCFSRRFGRIAPVGASITVPAVLFTDSRERPVLSGSLSQCAEISSSKKGPKQLIPRIDNVYKSWGSGGFDDKYEIEGEIGQGSCGTVYKARIKGTDSYRAVKKLDKKTIDLEDTQNEILSLLNLDHPHIIKLIRYYDEKNHLYLIFELCSGPDLFDAIKESMESSKGRMSEYDAAVALRHMLKAVKSCHGQFMGHYDIKPENFMYRSAERTNLKMIDLGMSSGFAVKSNAVKGTYDYMAPEIYRRIYGPEADVWSCGIVLFVMLTGVPFLPLDLDPDQMEQLVNNRQWVLQRLKWASEQGISSEAHSLLTKMLKMDRHLRSTVNEALEHPFIGKSYKQELHTSKQKGEAMAVLRGFQDNLRNFSAQPMLTRATMMLTAHLVAHNQDAMYPHRLAFRMLDKRGNGELSVDALEEALQSYNVNISQDLGDLFSLVDTDGNGYISFMEFLSVTLPQSVRSNHANFKAAFNFFDRNGDGFIDSNDLVKALGYKTAAEIETCKDAMREICPDSHRLSYTQFLHLVTGLKENRTHSISFASLFGSLVQLFGSVVPSRQALLDDHRQSE